MISFYGRLYFFLAHAYKKLNRNTIGGFLLHKNYPEGKRKERFSFIK